MESRTLKVELSEPRKRKQTTLVMSAERMSVNSVSWIASWMKRLLSKFTSILMSDGRVLRSSSSRVFTACAIATEFAPCCFLMPMPMPGYSTMGLACGTAGSLLEMSYPGLFAVPKPLGAVHVQVCVAPDGDAGLRDAALWVQNA